MSSEVGRPTENSENAFEGGRIWVAPSDIEVVSQRGDAMFLHPGSNLVSVDISKLRKTTPRYVYDNLYISTKSRLAQLGIEVSTDANEIIIRSLKGSGEENLVKLPVYNYSGCEFLIRNGAGLGRCFVSNGERLKGEELMSSIQAGEFRRN